MASEQSFNEWRAAADALRRKRELTSDYMNAMFGVLPGTFTAEQLTDINNAVRRAAFPSRYPNQIEDDTVEVLVAVSSVVAKQLITNGWAFQGNIKLLPPISPGDPYRLQFDGAVYGS